MKYTTLTLLFMLTACAKDPQGLRTPQPQSIKKCDSICWLIKDANKTQVTIVGRDVALNLLAEGY